MFYRLVAVLTMTACVAVGTVNESVAQDRYLEIAARHSRAHVQHDALVVPNGSGHDAFVTFRIPNSLLVFTQEKGGFEAEVDVTVELYQSGKKVADRVWRTTHSTATFDATQSPTDDLEGHVRFDVESGTYSYRVIVDDEGGDDRGIANSFHVPADDAVLTGSLVFGSPNTDSSRVTVEAANLGGNVPYGVDMPAIVPLRLGDGELDLSYQLYRLSPNRRDSPRRGGRSETPTDEPELQEGDELVSSGTAKSADLLRIGKIEDTCLCWEKAPSSSIALAVIPLGTDRLENGDYVLDVTAAGETRKYAFRTLWRDMPLSLYNVEVAIRNLEFIEERDTIRRLLKGSREQQVEAFRTYWERRDPTPGTVRNELMEEYYRRVDHAAVQFRTGQRPLPDGLETDPARIYILYGEPDRISNTLPRSGGVEQTWTYADGRTFVFWAASSLAPMELVD